MEEAEGGLGGAGCGGCSRRVAGLLAKAALVACRQPSYSSSSVQMWPLQHRVSDVEASFLDNSTDGV